MSGRTPGTCLYDKQAAFVLLDFFDNFYLIFEY